MWVLLGATYALARLGQPVLAGHLRWPCQIAHRFRTVGTSLAWKRRLDWTLLYAKDRIIMRAAWLKRRW
jgi:hypothetical protein